MAEKQCNLVKNGGGIVESGTVNVEQGVGLTDITLYKKDGVVTFNFALTTMALNAYSKKLLCTLPVGFRPLANTRFTVATGTFGGAFMYVNADGTVQAQALQNWSANGFTGLSATYFSA